MKMRPALFNDEMVRAVLEDRKTQDRRVIKINYAYGDSWECDGCEPPWPIYQDQYGDYHKALCPFGVPGDRLWVRETWRGLGTWAVGKIPKYPLDRDEIIYRADGHEYDGPWRPSIHMPRWASRITLEITGVRVERVQDITTCDVHAEGLRTGFDEHEACCDLADQFINLWDSINAKRGYSWESNPWVWVIGFKRIGGEDGGE